MSLIIGFHPGVSKSLTKKTTPVLFSRRSRDENIHLWLGENKLKFANQYRYLGVIFDKRLSWKPHIQDVALRCKKRFNILKVSLNKITL